MLIIGHIAGTSRVVNSEPRKGKVPPATRNCKFFKCCINACRRHRTRLAVHARMDNTTKAATAVIAEDAWRAMLVNDGSLSGTEFVAHTVHVMKTSARYGCR